MIALLQRVLEASVTVDGERIAAIGPGLLVLVAVQPGDDEGRIERMAGRLLAYRVFVHVHADLIAGLPGEDLSSFAAGFDRLVALCRARHPQVETGRFGAHMKVGLVNDGPVTFRLES